MPNPFNAIKRRVAMWQSAKFFSRIERAPVTRTPQSVGLEYDDVSLDTDDGFTLKAWFIPSGSSEKIVVFNHFMLGNRAGAVPHPDWGNVAVDFMPIYKALNEAGYSVFTYDLRNHGESDVYKDGALGLTHVEWRDVVAAVRYVRNAHPGADTYVYSQCYGTVATMRAMKNAPAEFAHIKGYVSLQPLSADAFIQGVTEKFGIDHPDNFKLFSGHLEKRTGIKAEDCLAQDLAPSVTVPTMLVQVHDDWRTKASNIEEIFQKTASKDKKLLWIEDEEERLEGYNYFARNPDELVSWLDAH